jgi:hypothetical protein
MLFTFNGDELRTTAPINFESSATLSIRVKVTDSGGLSYGLRITLIGQDREFYVIGLVTLNTRRQHQQTPVFLSSEPAGQPQRHRHGEASADEASRNNPARHAIT